MTDAEVFLWCKLRRKQLYGVIFGRQKTIGNYIVDFYCPAAQLVIDD
jgi:very-short-patch-repair endonuclease